MLRVLRDKEDVAAPADQPSHEACHKAYVHGDESYTVLHRSGMDKAERYSIEQLAQWAAEHDIVRAVGVNEPHVPTLIKTVPLVNSSSLKVGPLTFKCETPGGHPALREMFLWLATQPAVRRHERTSKSAMPPLCYVLDAVTVERDADCEPCLVLCVGERLVVVGDRVIEPAFTTAYEITELVVPARRRSSVSSEHSIIDQADALQPEARRVVSRANTVYSQICCSSATVGLPEQPHSQPVLSRPAFAEANRNAIRKLTLLELRNKGIWKGHDDFDALVDRLSLGVRFTFRRDFSASRISDADIIAEIRSNMNHIGC